MRPLRCSSTIRLSDLVRLEEIPPRRPAAALNASPSPLDRSEVERREHRGVIGSRLALQLGGVVGDRRKRLAKCGECAH